MPTVSRCSAIICLYCYRLVFLRGANESGDGQLSKDYTASLVLRPFLSGTGVPTDEELQACIVTADEMNDQARQRGLAYNPFANTPFNCCAMCDALQAKVREAAEKAAPKPKK